MVNPITPPKFWNEWGMVVLRRSSTNSFADISSLHSFYVTDGLIAMGEQRMQIVMFATNALGHIFK